MAKPGATGIARIISATEYSLKGLKACWKAEAAFRQEAMACVILVPLAFYLGDTSVEIALMILTCMLVLIVELLNSSIEAVVDRIGPEYHALSGQAKDIGSAAVMISIGTLIVTWSLLLVW